MRRLHLLVFLLFCVVGAQPAPAQISCNAFRGVSGPFGYRKMPDSERCEGLYLQQVSGGLDLLSLVNGRINYDLASDKNLIISLPALPPQFASAQVLLMAHALPRGTPYRMDAIVAAGSKFKWPLGPVLKQIPLQADSIGVVAWINQPLGEYYIPVSVAVENAAPSAPQPPTLIVRPSRDVEQLQWRVRPESGGSGERAYVQFGGDHPTIRAGQLASLEIRGQASGPAVVDLVANYVSGGTDTQLIRLILP
jgi:hypothetical protein